MSCFCKIDEQQNVSWQSCRTSDTFLVPQLSDVIVETKLCDLRLDVFVHSGILLMRSHRRTYPLSLLKSSEYFKIARNYFSWQTGGQTDIIWWLENVGQLLIAIDNNFYHSLLFRTYLSYSRDVFLRLIKNMHYIIQKRQFDKFRNIWGQPGPNTTINVEETMKKIMVTDELPGVTN